MHDCRKGLKGSLLIVPAAITCAVVLLSLLASCATSSGSTWRDESEQNEAARSRAQERAKAKPPAPRVDPKPAKDPWQAGVKGDRDNDGDNYLLRLLLQRKEKEASRALDESVRMRAHSASLVVLDLPPSAKVSVDGAPVHAAGSIRVLPGLRLVRVEVFGYEDFEAQIDCVENGSHSLRWEAVPRPFSVSGFSVDSPHWAAPVLAGKGAAGFRFELVATGPGRVRICMEDGEGRVLRHIPLDLEAPRSICVWDGQDEAGQRCPPGAYIARIEGTDHALNLTIGEAGLDGKALFAHSALSGLWHAVDTSILSRGGCAVVGSGTLFVPSGAAGVLDAAFTLRLGLGTEERWEFAWSTRGRSLAGSEGLVPDWIGASLGLKYLVAGDDSSALRIAATLRGTADTWAGEDMPTEPAPADPFSSWYGLAAGCAIEYRVARARLFGGLEYAVSDLYPELMTEAGELPRAFYWWTYLRGGAEGLILLPGNTALGLGASVALRSRQGALVWPPAGPIRASIECRYFSGKNTLVPLLAFSGSFEDPNNYWLGGGMGLSLRL